MRTRVHLEAVGRAPVGEVVEADLCRVRCLGFRVWRVEFGVKV